MYERFFGLQERPFDLTPNPRFLVLTDSHREVLSNLEYAIASRKGITLVIGEAGTGKTTMIRTVLRQQPAEVHSVHLQNPALSRTEFLETLAAKFGLSETAARSKPAMLSELEALLRERRARGEVTVLIVDEAQSASTEVLEEIRLLANIEADHDKWLSVILAGQPELAERLDHQDLRQLKQRVALRCQLRALNAHETAGYLSGRITAAGGIGARVFTREAVSTIHSAASGLPRTISVIADNALLGGFAAGVRPVTSKIVREVCADFRLPATEVAPPALEPLSQAPRNGSMLNLVEYPRTNDRDASPRDREQSPAVPAVEDGSTGWFSTFAGRRRRSFFGRG